MRSWTRPNRYKNRSSIASRQSSPEPAVESWPAAQQRVATLGGVQAPLLFLPAPSVILPGPSWRWLHECLAAPLAAAALSQRIGEGFVAAANSVAAETDLPARWQ